MIWVSYESHRYLILGSPKKHTCRTLTGEYLNFGYVSEDDGSAVSQDAIAVQKGSLRQQEDTCFLLLTHSLLVVRAESRLKIFKRRSLPPGFAGDHIHTIHAKMLKSG